MSENLTPEDIAAIETRLDRIKTDYEQRLKADRKHQQAVVSRLSWGVGVAFTVLAYFGIKGFEDIIDRAMEKKFPRTAWESIMQEVRDHALVQSLVLQEQDQRGTPAVTTETEALTRVLASPKTREQTFFDVVGMFHRMPANTIPPPVLTAMATLVKADPKENFGWMANFPKRQASLVLFLANSKYTIAAGSVLPLLGSEHRDLQLAAISTARDCELRGAVPALSKILKERGTVDDVQSAAAVALVSLGGQDGDAQVWLNGLAKRVTSLESATAVLQQLAVVTDLISQRQSRGGSVVPISTRTASGAVGASNKADEPADRAAVAILRSVLQGNYILTFARSFKDGKPLLYLAQDRVTFSNEDVSQSILGARYTDLMLKQELTPSAKLDNFKRLVRGLSGIVTDRNVEDVGLEVILNLGKGEIEFFDREKLSGAAVRGDGVDQRIAAGWALRSVHLSVNADGELMAETDSRMPTPASMARRGKVKAIKLADDSEFSLRPAGGGTGGAGRLSESPRRETVGHK